MIAVPEWFDQLYSDKRLSEVCRLWDAYCAGVNKVPVSVQQAIDVELHKGQEATNPKDLLGVRKSPLHLVPSALMIWVSQIFKFSAVKYGPFNWRSKKVKKSIYLDAIERHLIALKEGQDIDPESGKPHEAHIAANCAIMLDAKAIGNLVNDMTWESGPGPDLLKQVEDKLEVK